MRRDPKRKPNNKFHYAVVSCTIILMDIVCIFKSRPPLIQSALHIYTIKETAIVYEEKGVDFNQDSTSQTLICGIML